MLNGDIVFILRACKSSQGGKKGGREGIVKKKKIWGISALSALAFSQLKRNVPKRQLTRSKKYTILFMLLP